jgi:DNA-binding response OmpR family regulator
MSSKILIADDSLTIQKVIGITLATSGYQLIECLKEDDLLRKVHDETYDLVLLDFNLSDTKSGYDLALEIKKIQPNVGVIVMLGTFDTVDESKFEDNGINDKIIKPFESSKFIKKCKDVLETKTSFNLEAVSHKGASEVEESYSDSPEDSIDSWMIDSKAQEIAPSQFESSESDYDLIEIADESPAALDPLASEMKGWGFANTDSLESKFAKAFPPVIESNDDHHVLERLQSSSQFVHEVELPSSVNSLNLDGDVTNPTYEVPVDLNRELLSSIDEEVSAEAFWAVDEVVDVKSEETNDIEETHLDEVTADLTESVQAFRRSEALLAKQEQEKEQVSEKKHEPSLASTSLDKNNVTYENIDIDQLVEKLKVALLPKLEQIVKEYCKEMAEKVSWEVIPDLAENLIKKEIKEISDSVKH